MLLATVGSVRRLESMAAAVRQEKERTRLIVDCDPGVDDAQALLMALAHSDRVDLVAVTTVMGNSLFDNTTRNALRILHWAGRADVRVLCLYWAKGPESLLGRQG